jgi:3-methyladenine DNA glycosylase AlkD
MRFDDVLRELRRMANPSIARGLSRFGLPAERALGIRAPQIRALAKRIGTDHGLSLRLWNTGILEARVLAALVGDPRKVTRRQMHRWVREIGSWGECDACCAELFVQSPHALEMSLRWANDSREFVKRAGFVVMASAAIHRKDLPNRAFLPFLRAIGQQANDDRRFVRKAVNWALRQIGKRNEWLYERAIRKAVSIRSLGSSSARWIASDALRELRSAPVRLRVWNKTRRGIAG